MCEKLSHDRMILDIRIVLKGMIFHIHLEQIIV